MHCIVSDKKKWFAAFFCRKFVPSTLSLCLEHIFPLVAEQPASDIRHSCSPRSHALPIYIPNEELSPYPKCLKENIFFFSKIIDLQVSFVLTLLGVHLGMLTYIIFQCSVRVLRSQFFGFHKCHWLILASPNPGLQVDGLMYVHWTSPISRN